MPFASRDQFGHYIGTPSPSVDLLGVVELSDGGARWSFSAVLVIRASRKNCGNVLKGAVGQHPVAKSAQALRLFIARSPVGRTPRRAGRWPVRRRRLRAISRISATPSAGSPGLLSQNDAAR